MRKSTSKTSAKMQQSAVSNPIVPSEIQGPVTDYFGQVRGLLNGPQQGTYGPSSLQQAAFNGASQLSQPNANINAGLDSLRGLLDFRPGMAVNEYMNPYQQSVIDAAMGDLGRFQDRTLNNVQSNATRSGAFANSRLGVERALTNESFGQQAADAITGLRHQGWTDAYGRAMGDANFRQGTAQSLTAGGMGADANARANTAAQAELGDQQRAISQENDPVAQRAQFLAMLQRLLGVNPSDMFGQNVNTTGTQSGKNSQSGWGIGWSGSGGLTLGG